MKISTYWICQLGGWGTNIAISSFYYLTLSVRKIDHFFLLIGISVLTGIILTHLMRRVIKKYNFLEKPIKKQILYFILVTVVFAIVYACIGTGIEKIFKLPNNFSFLQHREFFNGLFYLNRFIQFKTVSISFGRHAI